MAEALRPEGAASVTQVKVPGALTLAMIFIACLAVYYFANWLWLSDVWHVR